MHLPEHSTQQFFICFCGTPRAGGSRSLKASLGGQGPGSFLVPDSVPARFSTGGCQCGTCAVELSGVGRNVLDPLHPPLR